MPRYNIHIDKPLPDKEHIARYKDFGGLYLDYEKATRFQFWRKLRTHPKYFATLVMVIVIGYLLYDSSRKQPVIEQDYIAENLPYRVLYKSSIISIPIGDTLRLESGLQIIIPPFAFVDSAGKHVEGEVGLSYRELKDPVDFFMDGIQLHVDSMDRTRLLESAGMVEIFASWQGNEFSLKPGASIQISFLSDKPGKDYGVFRMDEKARFWRYVGKDSVSLLMNESEILKKLPPKPRPHLIKVIPEKGQDGEGNELEFIPKSARTQPVDPTYPQRLKEWEKQCEAIRLNMKSEAMTVRRFSVSRLGYFCIGKEIQEKVETRTVTFKQEKYEDFPHKRSDVWVFQKGVNTIRRCPQTKNGKFKVSYYPDRDVSIWMNVAGINMGVVSSEKWEAVVSEKEGEVVIDLSVMKGPFRSLEEIKTQLIVPENRAL